MTETRKILCIAAPRTTLAFLLLGTLTSLPLAAQTATPEQKTEATAAVAADASKIAAEAPKEAGMPEECTKLVGALVACRQAGGWKQMVCEKGAQMQFSKCPIPVDKLPF